MEVIEEVNHKQAMLTDEFGNLHFETTKTIKYYKFDKYLFRYILEFIGSPRIGTTWRSAIVDVKPCRKKAKYITNEQNEFLKTRPFVCKPNAKLKITPYALNVNYDVNKLFVDISNVENKIICRVYDMKPVKQRIFYNHEGFEHNQYNQLLHNNTLNPLPQNQLLGGQRVYKMYQYTEYEKQNIIIGQFYLEEKDKHRISYSDATILDCCASHPLNDNVVYQAQVPRHNTIKYNGGFLTLELQ